MRLPNQSAGFKRKVSTIRFSANVFSSKPIDIIRKLACIGRCEIEYANCREACNPVVFGSCASCEMYRSSCLIGCEGSIPVGKVGRIIV